jgi:rare lipoprotein A
LVAALPRLVRPLTWPRALRPSAATIWLAALALAGCATGPAVVRAPSPDRAPPETPREGDATGPVERGTASWYGRPHHGRRTASGETYNMNALTAAHRRLPFGTRVRVTNLTNGRSVVVRVNDRGPYGRGRIIDVSREAARRIGLITLGRARVELEILGGP